VMTDLRMGMNVAPDGNQPIVESDRLMRDLGSTRRI
jgi:hypothetical protein